MRAAPAELQTAVVDLEAALRSTRVAVFDWETSDVRPHVALPVGLGVYLPETEEAYYINVGHGLADERFPRVGPDRLVAALRPFFADAQPRDHAQRKL